MPGAPVGGMASVPAHCLEDNIALKMPVVKEIHMQLLH